MREFCAFYVNELKRRNKRDKWRTQAPKKLAKPYLYPTKASARGARLRAAEEEVLARLMPGNPPRRISWSVQVRFCQFFRAQFRLRREAVA